MKTSKLQVLALAVVSAAIFALPAGSVHAQAEKSLDKCQKAAAKQSAAHVKSRTKAIAKCLQKISGELIKKNNPTPAAAAKACAAALRKIENTVDVNKTVSAKAKSKMRIACDPTVNAALAHSATQVTDVPPPIVTEGIEARNLNDYCVAFGGDGNIGTVEEWADCQLAASVCESNQQIGVEYPRAVEWLAAVKPHIQALGMDPKFSDGVTALDDIVAALDSDNDLAIDINCGPGSGECGNEAIDSNEECDGNNLNSQTCVTVGFPDGGTLACNANCGFNYFGCSSGTLSKTGQTTSIIDDDDGDIEAGPPFAFIDNGDGSITDQNSGLMWEKLSDDSTVHDQNNGYAWTAAFTDKIDKLNNRCNADGTTDCTAMGDAACMGVGGECGFLGHRDWRLPNRHELASLLDLGTSAPTLRPEFNNGCTLGCTILTCSCGPATPTWSSTTYHAATGQAWFINFQFGRTDFNTKGINQAVRAVRGPV